MLTRAREYAMHVLRRFGLDHLADTDCGSLAHGTKRLVEIARAICLEPMVLLLDEPAARSQRKRTGRALPSIFRCWPHGDLTLLIIEHNMEFPKTLATHMVCLDYGQLIASGPPNAIYQDERVIEAYIGSGHLGEQRA